MPRDVVALVSADDFVRAVSVFADRVHDRLLRSGLPLIEAIEAAELDAFGLLDELVEAPDTVVDLAGWWFACALDRGDREAAAAGPEAGPALIRLLATSSTEIQARTALAQLPRDEQAAVTLRDSYDLPPDAVRVALRSDADAAAELTAAGRIHFVAAYDAVPPASLAGHSGRTTVELASLSALAEGSLEAPRAAALRRHVTTCAACNEVLEALSRARRLAAGLPIIAMDDGARDALVARIAQRADAYLPTQDAVLRVMDEDASPGPPISPVVAVIVLVLAVALGVIIAAISQSGGGSGPGPTPAPFVTPTTTPGISTPPTALPQPTGPSGAPSGQPSQRPSKHPTRSPSRQPSHSRSASPPASPAAIAISPDSGARGSTITVRGTGWPPGSTVTVTYGHTGSTARATVDGHGGFVVTVQATAVLPGPEVVTARDGSTSASATYTQQV